MSIHLEPGDRTILIVAAVVLVALIGLSVVFSPPPAESPFGIPTSYSAASHGAKAAYLLLLDLGHQMQRVERPLTELPEQAENTLLILAEPLYPSSSEEKQALRHFLARGGRVLATGASAVPLLPGAEIVGKRVPVTFEWKKYGATLAGPITWGVPEITMASATPWAMKQGTHLGLYGDAEGAVVITYAVGKGRVYWWAAPTPLTNAGIRQPGNLGLLLNITGSGGGLTILWDEYHHGYQGTLWSYLQRTPIPWAGLQLVVVLVAALVEFARRHGPIWQPRIEPRLNPLEFVETLGDVYHHAHAASAAVATAYQRFGFQMTRQLGLPVTTKPEQMARSAADRLGWKEPGFLHLLQRCERATTNRQLVDSQALQLIQALQDYAERLRLKRRKPQEKTR